ncbi:MAG: tRNA (adenosine(37)-N6)-dimethylallyltransferase MiaA [Candidatus Roizmanbacteria bacterium]
MHSRIHIITGQTATGKTNHAIQLAKTCNGDIINFDSKQIYKDIDILPGKDKGNSSFIHTHSLKSFDIGYYVVDGVKIWLYDIVKPNILFSADDYEQCALFVIHYLREHNRIPIFVGGTYLYIKYLLYHTSNNLEPDLRLRSELGALSKSELQQKLLLLNPVIFNSMNSSDRENPYRLIRKIELSHMGKVENPIDLAYILDSKLNEETEISFEGYSFRSKEELYKLIEMRIEKRIKEGVLDEIQTLYNNGYTTQDPGMKSLGVRELIKVIQKETTLEEAKTKWLYKERQYAKRQITFMKRDPHITWHSI